MLPRGACPSHLPQLPQHSHLTEVDVDDMKEQIYRLTSSQIGVIVRDSQGVEQVGFVKGNKICRILKSKGLAPDLPKDLNHLIKKAVAVWKQLQRNKKYKDAKFRLVLTESHIH